MTNHRIRVLVAGDVYANRALVRPFLEDDGYEVVGEAFERADLMPQVIRQQPDAVVLDEAILAGRRGGKTLQRVRRAAPEAKLVVLTAAPAAFAEADATLETGLSLAALSALLGRLFAEDAANAQPVAVSAGAATMTSGVPGGTETSAPGALGSVARFVASVGLPLIVVWSMIALLTTGGRALLTRDRTTDVAAAGVVAIPLTDGPLRGAQDSLDALLHAIRAGNPVLATAHAQALMDARASARSLGYPVDGLDSDVGSSLSAVVGLLSPGAVGTLSGILDGLFPEIGGQAETPGAGSGLILGSAATPAGGGDVIVGGLGGGGDEGSAEGDGEGAGGNGSGGNSADSELGPGDGRAWGQSHDHADERREDPPGNDDVVHGYSDEAPGHDEQHRVHGHAWGHAKHRGHGDGDDQGDDH